MRWRLKGDPPGSDAPSPQTAPYPAPPAGSRTAAWLTTALAVLLFVACGSYIAVRFQWREAFATLWKADFVRLIFLISLSHFAYILVRAWRWRSSIRHVIPHVAFLDYYWLTAIVVSLAMFTPGHLGEALKIELMKRRGLLGRLPGIGAFALERLMDVVMISSMGAIGLFFASYAAPYPALKADIAALIVLGLMGLGALLFLDPGRRAALWLVQLRQGISLRTVITMALLTIVSWLLIAMNWKISLSAVQIHLTLTQVLLLISLVTVGAVLSFIPGGLGVSDLVTTVVLMNMGVVAVTAQAGALILHAYGLVIIVFGLLHLGLWPIYGRYVRLGAAPDPEGLTRATLIGKN